METLTKGCGRDDCVECAHLQPARDTLAALLAHARALRAALQDDPLGAGLTETLSRATELLWAAADEAAPQYRDDLREMGRILSGRASRIQEHVAAVLAAAQDGPA